MKLERTLYDFKKHLIHILAAGAIALSWGTVTHVNDYLHGHLTVSPSKAKTKKSRSKDSNASIHAASYEMTSAPPLLEMQGSSSTDRPIYAEAAVLIEPGPPAGPVSAEELKSIKPMQVAPVASASPTSVKTVQKVQKKTQPMAVVKPAPSVKTQTVGASSGLVTAVAAKMGVGITASKDISITQTKIDRKFIREVEGSALKAYVPLPKSTQSGVTIGDGFDIGQMRKNEFEKLPLSQSLKAKLRPYVGLRKMTAANFLKSHPLTISENELQELNVISANKDLQPLIKAYQKATGKSFLDLPGNVQTAMFSFAYQYGPGFMHLSGGRQLWHSFITQNWQKASTILRHFNDKYTGRRHQEAKLLERGS